MAQSAMVQLWDSIKDKLGFDSEGFNQKLQDTVSNNQYLFGQGGEQEQGGGNKFGLGQDYLFRNPTQEQPVSSSQLGGSSGSGGAYSPRVIGREYDDDGNILPRSKGGGDDEYETTSYGVKIPKKAIDYGPEEHYSIGGDRKVSPGRREVAGEHYGISGDRKSRSDRVTYKGPKNKQRGVKLRESRRV